MLSAGRCTCNLGGTQAAGKIQCVEGGPATSRMLDACGCALSVAGTGSVVMLADHWCNAGLHGAHCAFVQTSHRGETAAGSQKYVFYLMLV